MLIFLQTRARKQLEQEQQEAPGTTRAFARDANGEALPMEQLFLLPPRVRMDHFRGVTGSMPSNPAPAPGVMLSCSS